MRTQSTEDPHLQEGHGTPMALEDSIKGREKMSPGKEKVRSLSKAWGSISRKINMTPHTGKGWMEREGKVGDEIRASKLTATYKTLIVLSSKVRNMHS